MKKRGQRLPLQKLTAVEILSGLVLYLPRRTFREENLYTSLENTGDPRFQTRTLGNMRYSRMVHMSLTFCEIGQIIYETDSIYHIVQGMRKPMERVLRRRNVLPKHAKVLRALARSFADTQNRAG